MWIAAIVLKSFPHLGVFSMFCTDSHDFLSLVMQTGSKISEGQQVGGGWAKDTMGVSDLFCVLIVWSPFVTQSVFFSRAGRGPCACVHMPAFHLHHGTGVGTVLPSLHTLCCP